MHVCCACGSNPNTTNMHVIDAHLHSCVCARDQELSREAHVAANSRIDLFDVIEQGSPEFNEHIWPQLVEQRIEKETRRLAAQ